jgi:hypothetical protein
MLELVNTMAISYIIISVLDYLFIKNFNSRYFLIHVLVNAYIIFICLFDTFNVLFNTIETLKLRTTDNTALYLMLTLHLYHITPNIGFKLNFIDYLHHFSSAFLGGILLLFTEYGPLQNYNFMFVCGLPGFIDYLLLVLVKEKVILPITEKYYNNFINLWIRSPFLVGSVFLSWIQMQIQTDIPYYIVIMRYFCMIIQFWNAQFFLERVIKSYWLNVSK